MTHYLLAIDQGTTNSRAIIFNQEGNILSQHELPLTQYFPHDGWVEQDPEEMFNNTLSCCRMAMQKINLTSAQIAAIGISNQRETTIVWNKKTGKPIYAAIVWQDRRTSDLCAKLSSEKIADTLSEKTGLLLDPYFSATKLQWILNYVTDAREQAARDELLFGTVDTFLIWKLTGGKSHVTDATNASRTLLFNIRTQQWDTELLQAFDIPMTLLPTVLDNAADFGVTDSSYFGGNIRIAGVAGDQQAATIGQTCFMPGMVKVTYGTGCFMLLNTGEEIVHSKNKLLSTVAYRFNNTTTYGLEGSIFCAGVTVKWLRDSLKLIQTAAETESIAESVPDTGGVYLVPAFTGLGAPYWDPYARGALLGLTRNSNKAHIVRAALESVAYQTRDLLEAMVNDGHTALTQMRVDGGMVVNNWLLQFIADILDLNLQRPTCIETSALGAAFLAGLQVGIFDSLEALSHVWKMDRQFSSQMLAALREQKYSGWQAGVHKIL